MGFKRSWVQSRAGDWLCRNPSVLSFGRDSCPRLRPETSSARSRSMTQSECSERYREQLSTWRTCVDSRAAFPRRAFEKRDRVQEGERLLRLVPPGKGVPNFVVGIARIFRHHHHQRPVGQIIFEHGNRHSIEMVGAHCLLFDN